MKKTSEGFAENLTVQERLNQIRQEILNAPTISTPVQNTGVKDVAQ